MGTRADAEAIAEAALRPSMRFVVPKREGQQASSMIFRTRDLFVRQKTQLINALRAHLGQREVRRLLIHGCDRDPVGMPQSSAGELMAGAYVGAQAPHARRDHTRQQNGSVDLGDGDEE